MKLGVVVTTINHGNFIEPYCKKMLQEEVHEDTTLYVVADTKTPSVVDEFCYDYQRQGYNVKFMDMHCQDAFLRKLDLKDIVPYNSDNRRNVGYLKAVEEGNDIIISIDDDNYCKDEKEHSFFKHHAVVGKEWEGPITCTSWYNNCRTMQLPAHVFPRGFPYNERKNALTNILMDSVSQKIAVNAGMWDIDPDVDALTWLTLGYRKFDASFNQQEILLGHKSWCPINSQNTAVSRDAMLAYYFIPMKGTVNGMSIDRYGDIFQGYFLQACVKAMGEGIKFGNPTVRHLRNKHNYMDDLLCEMACTQMMEELLQWLPEAELDNTSYMDSYLSLSEQLEDAVEKFSGKIWSMDSKSFIHRTGYCMRRWIKAFNLVN